MSINDTRLFAQHMSSLHSLPVFRDQFQPTRAPAETAFNGTLQSYHLPPPTTQANTDLAQFMLPAKTTNQFAYRTKTLKDHKKFNFVLIFNSKNRVKTKIRKMSFLKFMQIRS